VKVPHGDLDTLASSECLLGAERITSGILIKGSKTEALTILIRQYEERKESSGQYRVEKNHQGYLLADFTFQLLDIELHVVDLDLQRMFNVSGSFRSLRVRHMVEKNRA
jgi:hypothetical protein